jgi:hypothetical protein
LLCCALQWNAMKHGRPDDGAGIGLGSAMTLLIKVSFVFLCSGGKVYLEVIDWADQKALDGFFKKPTAPETGTIMAGWIAVGALAQLRSPYGGQER